LVVPYASALAAAFFAGFGPAGIAPLTGVLLLCAVPALQFLGSGSQHHAKRIETAAGIWTIAMYLTLGAMQEEREGGTAPGGVLPDGEPFPQDQETRRYDAGLVASVPAADVGTFQFRASGMTQDHEHLYGSVREQDSHRTAFAEASLSGKRDATSWLVGLAYQTDEFASDTFPEFDYDYRGPAVFAQAEQDIGENLTLAASARLDDHSEYGSKFSPRVSALYRPSPWTVRASLGQGFYAPTPSRPRGRVQRRQLTGKPVHQPTDGDPPLARANRARPSPWH
jgi:outer membrane receptor protein involved in Fe transport